MRFRFCGDLDCPDWVLAEISTLAKIITDALPVLNVHLVVRSVVSILEGQAGAQELADPAVYDTEEECQSSVKLKLICAQVLKEQLGETIDYEKILKLTADARFGLFEGLSPGAVSVPSDSPCHSLPMGDADFINSPMSSTASERWEPSTCHIDSTGSLTCEEPVQANCESGDIKATVAVLCFILSSAAKHNVSGDNLSSELQQLGLPREHAVSLCRSYEEKQTALQETLKENSLRLSRLSSVSWRVDQTLRSSILQEVNEPIVQLNLCVKDSADSRPVSLTMSASKLRVLLIELKRALEMMNSLN